MINSTNNQEVTDKEEKTTSDNRTQEAKDKENQGESPEKSQEEKEKEAEQAKQKKYSHYSHILYGAIICLAVAVAASLILCQASNCFGTETGNVSTFTVSFLIGLCGAGIFLIVLLLAEGNLDVLDNDMIDHIPLMAFLFVLAGGFLAAVTQVSTGLFEASNAQTVFFLGFGWLGALTGVAGVKQKTKLKEEKKEVEKQCEKVEEEKEMAIDQKEDKEDSFSLTNKILLENNEKLQEKLKELNKRLEKAENKGGSP